LIVVLSFALAPTTVAAEDYTKIGVKVGDTAEYSFTMTGVPTPTTLSYLISNVTGTNVTISSAGSTIVSGNVSAGGNGIWLYLIAANLTAGDPLYVGAPYSINETITMTAAGESRAINHFNLTTTVSGYTVIEEIYWDKLTGLMTGINDYISGSGWTNQTLTTTSLFGVPAGIKDLAAISPTQNSITLNWTAPGNHDMAGNATGYVVKYSTAGPINSTNWASATNYTQSWKPAKGGTTDTEVVSGLSASTTYYFAVEAYNGESLYGAVSNSPSATTLAVPDTTPPANITNLNAGNPTATSITLSWTAPGDNGMSGNATGYVVKYSTSGVINSGNWLSATTYTQNWTPAKNGTTETHNITGLSGDTTYWFAIEAYDKVPNYSGVSNSPSAKTLDNIPPATIGDLSTSNPTNTSVTLTWTAPGNDGMIGNATGYVLKYSTIGAITSANWSSAATYTQSWTPLPSGSREAHVVLGLSPDTTYWFAVEAFDAVPNYGSVSNSPSMKTLVPSPPATITDLAAGNPTTNSITLTWTAPGDNAMQGTAKGYIVRYSMTGPINSSNWNVSATYVQTWIPLPAGSNETHVVTGLSSNTTYWFAIEAYDEVPTYSNVSTISPSARTLAASPQFGGFAIGASNLTAIILVAAMVALVVVGLAVYRRRWKRHWVTIKPQDDLS
jgi:chitodextrinase